MDPLLRCECDVTVYSSFLYSGILVEQQLYSKEIRGSKLHYLSYACNTTFAAVVGFHLMVVVEQSTSSRNSTPSQSKKNKEKRKETPETVANTASAGTPNRTKNVRSVFLLQFLV